MRICSSDWTKIAARGDFCFEAKAKIGNKEYTAISAPEITRSIASAPLSVGNCVSATLRLSILTDDPLSSQNPVIILGRLVNAEISTEWKEFGTFFIDQRDTSFEGLVTLECYDAMLKGNQPYLTISGTSAAWPKSMKTVVSEIAQLLGVGIDLRTRIKTDADYIVPYPEGKTVIQVLGSIGACHGGNWIITEENLLRLVPLTTAPDETFHVIDEDFNKITLADGIGNQPVRLAYKDQTVFNTNLPETSGEYPGDLSGSATAYSGLINVPVVCGQITNGKTITVSKIKISNDDSDSYTAGNSTGVTLEISENPCASQNICDDLYTAFNGLVYQPFTASRALFDPAAELGDQVKIGEHVFSSLFNMKLVLDHNFRADISAPNSEELSTEYPFYSSSARLQQMMHEAASSIRANANKLLGKVDSSELADEITRATQAESDLTALIGSEQSRAENSETELSERITTLEQQVSTNTVDIQNIKNKITALENTISALSDRVSALESEQPEQSGS